MWKRSTYFYIQKHLESFGFTPYLTNLNLKPEPPNQKTL